MTRSLGVKAWATGTALLAAVTACANSGSDADAPPSPSLSSPSPTSTSTSSSPPPSQAEAASASAEAAVRRYFVVLDSLRQDPAQPAKQLSTVATSTQLAAQRRLLANERGHGLRQVGTTKVAELTVQSVNLDNTDPSVGRVPAVTVDVCWDVSGADLVDKGGKSVVSSDRASIGWTRYTVANYHWSDNPSGGWRVATSQDLKQAPCAAY